MLNRHRSFFGSSILILAFLIISNNFFSKSAKIKINSDGRAYYEYLPAIFIYKDLRLNYLDTLVSKQYDANYLKEHFYKKQNGIRINKCFVGTPLLQLPFFFVAHTVASIHSDLKADGFSMIYQNWIYYGAVFYLFIGLLCLFKLMRTYEVSFIHSFLLLAGLVFCTSLPVYVYQDSAYSHVYSFAMCSVFLYSLRQFDIKPNSKYALSLIVSLSLLVLIRPTNALILMFVPFVLKDLKTSFSSFWNFLRSHRITSVLLILLAILLLSIQFIIWKWTYGTWIVYSYGEEGFIWSHLHFLDFLFSTQKGFFFWSPWFFCLFFASLIYLIIKKSWEKIMLFFIPFYFLIFVFSSWWVWQYGGSYGSRPLIEYYPCFVLLFIPFLQKNNWINSIVLLVCLSVFAPITITQVYQYQKYILKISDTTWEEYQKVFMKKGKEYEGYLWRKPYFLDSLLFAEKHSFSGSFKPFNYSKIDSLQIPIQVQSFAQVVVDYSFEPKSKLTEYEILSIDVKDSNHAILQTEYCSFFNLWVDPDHKKTIRNRFQLNNPSQSAYLDIHIETKEKPLVIQERSIQIHTFR